MPMQPGDVPRTFASADLLEAVTGYRPATDIEVGVAAFVEWYRWWRTVADEDWSSQRAGGLSPPAMALPGH
jgi:UDP-glucuronate 4-epimerase